MPQEPDPPQRQPDQPPYGPGPSAWPGPPWDQQPRTDPPPGPQPMPTQGQPPKKEKRFGWLALSLATVGALIVGGTAGSLGASGDGGTAAIPAATVTVTATEAAEPAPAPTVKVTETTKAKPEPEPEPEPEPQPEPESDRISDGSYEVGVDIDPGRYKTVTPAEDNGSVCYAEVYTADDPLEPDTLETEMTYSGLTIIDIPKKKSAIFWSEGCGEWKRTR